MDEVVKNLVASRQVASYNSLGPDLVTAAKRAVLDAVGCAYAATAMATPKHITETVQSVVGQRPCSVIGTRARTTAELAAFANGTLVRYLDLNDTYVAGSRLGHPSDYIPAVLAAAEECDAEGTEILAAVSLAYETYCRLMDGIELSGAHYDNVLYGSVASAMAAAYLWDLSETQVANAVALALVPNIALRATRFGVVSEWKGIASGNSCRNGVFAARLASHNITGPDEPFTGTGGLCVTTHAAVSWDRFLRRNMMPALLQTHFKCYPAGFFAQTAIEATLDVRARIPRQRRARAIEVHACDEAIRLMANDESKWRPSNRHVADHSLPYLVAFALLNGTVDESAFGERNLADEGLRSVVEKVIVVANDECNRDWPDAIRSEIVVVPEDGQQISSVVRFHHGHANNPLSEEELVDRVRERSESLAGKADVDRAIYSIAKLESMGARELMRNLSLAPQ